jgi:hypothetical protein
VRHIAEANLSTRVRLALVVLAVLYLAAVWIEGVRPDTLSGLVPRPLMYFTQIAALFPRAATMNVEYRAEAWICSAKKWVELDTRPYFPLDPDDKENRFQRVMHFYREHRQTMQALDAFLVGAHADGRVDDGVDKAPIGGVRLLSLRLPLPSPGERVARPVRLPLSSYSEADRHEWYWTPKSKRAERCGGPVE